MTTLLNDRIETGDVLEIDRDSIVIEVGYTEDSVPQRTRIHAER